MRRDKHITKTERLALLTYAKARRVLETVTASLRPSLAEMGLTESQFAVLEVLYSLGPQCQRAIAEKVLKTSGNITMVIDNLEKQGCVTRQRETEDRRLVTVSLTEKGTQVITEVFPRHAKNVAAQMQALTPEEQKTLRRLARKLESRKLEKGEPNQ